MVLVADSTAVLASPTAGVDAASSDVCHVDTVDDEFYALVYSDEQLLRDEFDALIAAAWSDLPPPTVPGGRRAEPPRDSSAPGLAPVPCRRPAASTARVRGRGGRTRAPPGTTGSP